MKRLVTVVQVLAVGCAIAFVVLLFANEPDDQPAGGTPAAAVDGATVYENRCAGCHGGDGGGGLGPQLSDGRVVQRFPDIADHIAVITDGRGGMPGFGDRLSEAEITAVAEYERTL